jgi:hypothetical protein
MHAGPARRRGALSDDDVQRFNALRRTKRPFDSVPLR